MKMKIIKIITGAFVVIATAQAMDTTNYPFFDHVAVLESMPKPVSTSSVSTFCPDVAIHEAYASLQQYKGNEDLYGVDQDSMANEAFFYAALHDHMQGFPDGMDLDHSEDDRDVLPDTVEAQPVSTLQSLQGSTEDISQSGVSRLTKLTKDEANTITAAYNSNNKQCPLCSYHAARPQYIKSHVAALHNICLECKPPVRHSKKQLLKHFHRLHPKKAFASNNRKASCYICKKKIHVKDMRRHVLATHRAHYTNGAN